MQNSQPGMESVRFFFIYSEIENRQICNGPLGCLDGTIEKEPMVAII